MLADGLAPFLPALIILVGILGIIVPVLPGLFITVVGMLVWALQTDTTTGWVLFGLSVLIALGGFALQFLIPGRRMKREGVKTSTLFLAVCLGIVGFFVVPFVGAALGFVLGIYLVEHARTREWRQAWHRTRTALVAVLQSIGIELGAAFLVATVYVIGLVVT